MMLLPILCAIVAAVSGFPQHAVQQQVGAVPAAPTFFFSSPVATPTVFALTPPALPQHAAAASAASAVAPAAAASAAGAVSASSGAAAASAVAAPSAVASPAINPGFTTTHFQASESHLASNPSAVPILPADLARAYTESNLRLAIAYREAEKHLAAANQKAAQDALHQAIAGASAAAAAGEKAAAAPAAPAAAEVTNSVVSAAPQGANSGLVLPLGFQGIPISIVQPFGNQQLIGG